MATRLFHQNVRAFFLNLNVESLEVVRIDGQKWYRVKPKAEFPTMMVGIKDSYLIVAVGEGSLDMILERMQKPAPHWLVEARRIATFERPTRSDLHQPSALARGGPGWPPIRAASRGSNCSGWRNRLGWSPPAVWSARTW